MVIIALLILKLIKPIIYQIPTERKSVSVLLIEKLRQELQYVHVSKTTVGKKFPHHIERPNILYFASTIYILSALWFRALSLNADNYYGQIYNVLVK